MDLTQLTKTTGLTEGDFTLAVDPTSPAYSDDQKKVIDQTATGMVAGVERAAKEGDAKYICTHADESTMAASDWPVDLFSHWASYTAAMHRQATAIAAVKLAAAGHDVTYLVRDEPSPVHPTMSMWELEESWAVPLSQSIEATGGYSHPDDDDECSVAVSSWAAEMQDHYEPVAVPFGHPQGVQDGFRILPGTDIDAVFAAWDAEWQARNPS